MKRRTHILAFLALAALLVSASAAAASLVREYVEDFTTKDYCDTTLTTALWNTAGGWVGLHPFEVTVADTISRGTTANGMDSDGRLACVVDYPDGIDFFDISYSGFLMHLASHTSSGNAVDVTLWGDYLYLAQSSAGIEVIDVSDPNTPALVGSYDTPGHAYEVAIAGDYAYVADDESGLQVLDISSPSAPALAGSHDTAGKSRGVAVAGDFAYVADRDGGLLSFDITDPTNPALAGSLALSGLALGVTLEGDYAYVSGYDAGVHVVDISAPSLLSLAATYDTPHQVYRVSVEGDVAYVCDGYTGLVMLDVSDPTAPALLEQHDTSGSARDVFVAGAVAFVADNTGGLVSLNVGYPMIPEVVASGTGSGGSSARIVVAGDYAYMVDASADLEIFDISDPENPTFVASQPLYTSGKSVAVDGDLIFGLGDEYLDVIDGTDPTSPSLLGYVAIGYPANDVAVSGDVAYVLSDSYGLVVVDVSAPASPAIITITGDLGDPQHLKVVGDILLVTEPEAGLMAFDVTNPASPVLLDTQDTDGTAGGFDVRGDVALVADGPDRMRSIAFQDPSALIYLGFSYADGVVVDVAFSGDRAYALDSDGRIEVFDVTGAVFPEVTIPVPGSCDALAVHGDHAFVASDGTLYSVQITQREFDGARDRAVSTDIDPSEYRVAAARLESTQSDSVKWKLAPSLGYYTTVSTDFSWHSLSSYSPADGLFWWSDHYCASGETNPSCSELRIEWLYDVPVIESVLDVPEDQGHQISLTWVRSGHDLPGSYEEVTGYAVYRRYDEVRREAGEDRWTDDPAAQLVESSPAKAAQRTERAGSSPGEPEGGEAGDGQSADASRGSRYPPGQWHYLLTVPAVREQTYSVVVPTLGDSTAEGGIYNSVFFVRALGPSPGTYYDSQPDSGWSVDNLAPAEPTGLAVDYSATENDLSWDACPDEDFRYFRVYRGLTPDFEPSQETLLHATTGTSWTDEVEEGWQYRYCLTAVDLAGNESTPAGAEQTTGIDDAISLARFALYQNAPNPVRTATTIRFDVPVGGGEVTLEVYDLAGRLVRTLVEGALPEGRRTVAWDLRDEHGLRVASGVYYCRMRAPGFERSLKMTVVR